MAVDDSYTKALLHMDGSDGSTTFTDESGKAWTRVGNAQIDTAQSKFGGASGYFDGSGDYVTTPDSDDWYLSDGSDSNSWTVDFWVRFNGDPGTGRRGFFSQWADNSNYTIFNLDNNELVVFVRYAGGAIINIRKSWNPSGNTWYHIALVKQGTTGYRVYVNGSEIESAQVDTSPYPNISAVFRIGTTQDSAGTHAYMNGWIDEFRLSKGIARWTGNFTPPTEPYAPLATPSGKIIWIM